MNLREGTRRLALLLGAVGAILGGFVSYSELQTVLSQRARHIKFEQLAASDVVKHERQILQAWTPAGKTYPSGIKPWDLPWDPSLKPGDIVTPDQRKQEPQPDFIPDESLIGARLKSHDISDDVDEIGVKSILWSKDFTIKKIETVDGQTLYPTPAPSIWMYVLVALFPILGFFIPWGAIRVIVWVGAGFVLPSKSTVALF